jgi:hypothetical protein
MNESNTSSSVWGILAGLALIVILLGGSVYLVAQQLSNAERARAEQWTARQSIAVAQAYAQVEIARVHEAASVERAQVFALTLRSFTTDNSVQLTLLSLSVGVLAVLQLVQAVTRPRGGA